MRAAEIKEEEKKIEEKVMKLKDLSEWKTKDSESIKAKTQLKPKIISIGYSALNQNGPIVGRKVFGEEPKKEVQQDEESEIDRAFRLEKEEKKKAIKRYTDSDIPKKNKKRKSSPNE